MDQPTSVSVPFVQVAGISEDGADHGRGQDAAQTVRAAQVYLSPGRAACRVRSGDHPGRASRKHTRCPPISGGIGLATSFDIT